MPATATSQLSTTLSRRGDYWLGQFGAMASPCEILIDDTTHREAIELLEIAHAEAIRIEQKFSRYLTGNIIHHINHANGKSVDVDDETAKLLDYASECWSLSEGLFDVTSGVLRRVWKFDGSDRVPVSDDIAALLPFSGWEKVPWENNTIRLLPEMEIDLGGIGKEYAVDTTATLLKQQTTTPFLVNYGGDLFISGRRKNGKQWNIGFDDPHATDRKTYLGLHIERGGVATSGDAKRFLLKNGIRYSHILNPKTGCSITNAPASVTVIADTCIEAGILSTIACLHGDQAEEFLKMQGVKYLIHFTS